MKLEEYKYIECRDLRHSWRGNITHTVYSIDILRRERPRSARLKQAAVTHVLQRRVGCTSCPVERVEEYGLRKGAKGFYVYVNLGSHLKYPHEGYLLTQEEKERIGDFRRLAINMALQDGRAVFVSPKE